MKYIGIIITVATLLGGIVYGYGELTQETKTIVGVVAEVKEEVKDHSKEIVDMQKFDIQQSMILERIVEKLDKLER